MRTPARRQPEKAEQAAIGRFRADPLPEQLARQCQLVGLPAPLTEFVFHPTRKWRLDLAWLDRRLGVEVQGAVYVQGRHSRGAGIEGDCEKFAEAAILGWTVLTVTPRHVKTGQALKWIEQWWQRQTWTTGGPSDGPNR